MFEVVNRNSTVTGRPTGLTLGSFINVSENTSLTQTALN